MTLARDYPWQELPRVSRRETLVARALKSAHPHATPGSLVRALTALLGHPITVERLRRGLVAPHRLDLGARGTVLVLGSPRGAIAIEVEAELALAIVGALAGARGIPRIARGRKVEPEVAGALAGVAQHLAREHVDLELAVTAIDATADDARRALGVEDALTIDVALKVGALRSNVRVAVSIARAVGVHAEEDPPRATLAAMGETPIVLHAVIASGWAAAASIVIGLGDVVVVDGLSRGDRCVLAHAKGSSGVAGSLVGEGVRLGSDRVALAAAPAHAEKDGAMAEPTDATGATMEVPALDSGGTLVEVLAETPVHVRVEVGSISMSAREWASLSPGDVIALDRRVGDAVSLRVAGKVVGRGELVDVEGAIGVRILERAP